MTDEQKRKISISKLGFSHSEETKKKMSESHKRAWKNRKKNGYGKTQKRLDNLYKDSLKNIKANLTNLYGSFCVNKLNHKELFILSKLTDVKNYLNKKGLEHFIAIENNASGKNHFTLFPDSSIKLPKDEMLNELYLAISKCRMNFKYWNFDDEEEDEGDEIEW